MNNEKMPLQEAIMRLKDICSRSEKSAWDIRKKLNDWNMEKHAGHVIEILTKDLFIDNQRYARSFAKDKIKFNKWGMIKIRFMLKSRQIASEDIEKALSSIDFADYKKMVFAELARKKVTLKISDQYIVKSKLYAFGNQRGFENSLVNEYIESVNL